MLFLTAALGALLGGLFIVDPMGMRQTDDTDDQPRNDPKEQPTEDQGSILDEVDSDEDSDDDILDPSQPPVDDTNLAPPTDMPASGVQPDGYDAVAGDNLTDGRGGGLTNTAGPATDPILGTSDANRIGGSDQHDFIMGNEGDDTINAGDGDDYIDGGADDDLLLGQEGDDHIQGQPGDDDIDGGEGDDFLVGGDGDDTLAGREGNDTLFAGRGADSLSGGDGDDLLDGSFAADGVADTGADNLDGGAGNDVIALGSGDTASGGDGNDTYIFGGPGIGAFAPDSDNPLPTIQDFDADDDVLELVIGDQPPGDISIRPEDGGLTILVDGQAVARLNGVSDLDVDQIRLAAA